MRLSAFWNPPAAPLRFDAGDLDQLDQSEVRAHLDQVAAERRRNAERHQRVAGQLGQERDHLVGRLVEIEDTLRSEGARFSDRERELDQYTAHLTAMLVGQPGAGEPDPDDELTLPDDRDVQRLLRDMQRGKVRRSEVVGGTPALAEAVQLFDRQAAELRTWSTTAADIHSATGRLPEPPAVAKQFSDETLRSITRGLLPR